jgi:hypothetical protein
LDIYIINFFYDDDDEKYYYISKIGSDENQAEEIREKLYLDYDEFQKLFEKFYGKTTDFFDEEEEVYFKKRKDAEEFLKYIKRFE